MGEIKEEKPQIKISDPAIDAINIVRKEIRDVQKFFNWTALSVIAALVIGFLTLLFMVANFLIDSWHFNSAVYQEYSSKIQTQNDLLKANEDLLEQNKQNQDFIKNFINNYSKK